MKTPTRFIDKEEFNSLMELENNTIPLFKLAAIPFLPPTPDEPNGPIDYSKEYKTIRIMMLNVLEPRLYRDENKVVFIVLPSYETVTYEIASAIHPEHDEWGYRFSPYSWDGEEHMADATYLFKDETIPNFDLSNTATY